MRSSIETPILSTSHVGSDPSRLEPLRPVPHANCGFTELRTTRIHKPPGRGWQFNIDDAPLADAEEAPAHAWTWTPGFYAGEVTGELLTADGYIAGTYLFDVSPDPAKLGGDLFAEMIREVWDEDPVLILGSEPAQTLAGDLGGSGDPLIGFARLRRYGPAFVRALHEISSRPIQTAHQVRQQVPIHAAKRADRQTALGTLHNTTALRILTGAVDTGSAGIGSGTVLDVPVSESHFDGAANRCVTSLALAVARQTSEIHQALGRLSQNEEPSDTRTALAPRWPARARFLLWLVDQLNGVLAHSPFSAVSRPEVTAAGLNAAAAHPLSLLSKLACEGG